MGSSLSPLQGNTAPLEDVHIPFLYHLLINTHCWYVRMKTSALIDIDSEFFSLYTAVWRATSSIHHTNSDETPQKWTRCWNLRFTLTDGYFI